MRKQETIIPVLVSKSNEAAKIGNEVYKNLSHHYFIFGWGRGDMTVLCQANY